MMTHDTDAEVNPGLYGKPGLDPYSTYVVMSGLAKVFHETGKGTPLYFNALTTQKALEVYVGVCTWSGDESVEVFEVNDKDRCGLPEDAIDRLGKLGLYNQAERLQYVA